jgi:hypothetical protein
LLAPESPPSAETSARCRRDRVGSRAGGQVGAGWLEPGEGRSDGARRRSAEVLTAAEGRAAPGPWSGRGESRTSDGSHQKPSWGGEVAGTRGGPGGQPQVLENGLGRRGAEHDGHDAAGAPQREQ